jgi:hypothetical protein
MKDIGLSVHQRLCDLEGSWSSSSLEPLRRAPASSSRGERAVSRSDP